MFFVFFSSSSCVPLIILTQVFFFLVSRVSLFTSFSLMFPLFPLYFSRTAAHTHLFLFGLDASYLALYGTQYRYMILDGASIPTNLIHTR